MNELNNGNMSKPKELVIFYNFIYTRWWGNHWKSRVQEENLD
jgi:hypothetical protein